MKHERNTEQERLKPQLTPLAKAIRHHRRLIQLSLLAASTTLAATPVLAQEAADEELILEEITVTAQKREQSMQDVPIAVTAFDGTLIDNLGLQNFSDFAMMVPNLAYKSTSYQGPVIIMRGASDGGDGNPSGQSPSVAVYLDEQPVSFIGGQLDIHIYDMARIEALAGPQGTLYGASSQTGTVRYITNKPDPTAFAGGFDLQGMGTKNGDPGYSAEGFVNIPIGERAALRLVGWYVEEGGWIDNVATDENTRPGPQQLVAGQYTYPLFGTGGVAINTNEDFVENDINELTKAGLRAALGVELSDNWTGTLGLNYQDTETEGVWEHAPDMVGEGNIQRYSEDTYDDEWTQFSLTIDGEFANHSLVYAGAFMDRETEYNQGYNAYGEYATWVNYYACDYTGTETDCTTLEEQAIYPVDTDRTSHELRLVSLADNRLHYTVGMFYEKIETDYNLQWFQPGMSQSLWVEGIENLYFRTDQEREDSQFAIFGELTYDISDSVSITGGARWFDEEATISGVVGYDGTAYVPSPGKDTHVNAKATNDDVIFKANLTWNVSDEALLYFTWSEGYRPGGVNREPTFVGTELEAYIPDVMTNYEFGWKTTLADGRVRFNGAAYFMDWDDIQFTIYDFGLSACCGNTYNLSTAEIKGAEFDLTWIISQGWMLSLAAAYNDAETTGDFVLPNGALSVPKGTPLPNVPELQASGFLRYNFNLTDTLPAYAQLAWSYSDSSWSEIQPSQAWNQRSYNFGNFRTGIDRGNWGLDLFINNLTDERADLYVHPRSYEMTTTTNRPRNYGLRFWSRFE